jgi:F-type H+-transporting ATPase subunit b
MEVIVIEAAGRCVGPDGRAIGMPQLCFDWFPNQIFWLFVALVAIWWILSRIALPRIGAVLAERQGTITNDIAAAEELKLKAVAAEKAYDKALADARAEAAAIVARNRAELQGSLDEAIAQADVDIAERTAESEARISAIRDGMAESVADVARDTARVIVGAMGGNVDDGAVDAAVKAQLGGAAPAGGSA